MNYIQCYRRKPSASLMQLDGSQAVTSPYKCRVEKKAVNKLTEKEKGKNDELEKHCKNYRRNFLDNIYINNRMDFCKLG